MLTVGSSMATGLALLQAVQAGPSHPVAPSAPAQTQPASMLTGASKLSLSAAVSETVLGIAALPSAAPVGSSVASGPAALVRQEVARSTGMPADKVVWLESFGADAWVLRDPMAMDEAEFKRQVLDSLVKSGTAKLEGFAEAQENGTLTILHASEMPELGYKSFQVTLYKDGAVVGGAGFSTTDADHRLELRRSGIFAATGAVEGNDYVVTWAMPWEADSVRPDFGSRAAA